MTPTLRTLALLVRLVRKTGAQVEVFPVAGKVVYTWPKGNRYTEWYFGAEPVSSVAHSVGVAANHFQHYQAQNP